MQAKLTKRAVDAASATERDSFIWDSEIKGFGLKVTPKGRKAYIVQCRVSGRVRRYTIGVHGSPWTPDMARSEALRLLGLVHQGADPAEEKKIARIDLSMAELCELYLAEGCGAKKASTVVLDQSRIKRHIVPLLGHMRLRQVTRTDVERFMADVAGGKTAVDERTRRHGRAVVKGGKGAATRTVGLLGAILQFAVHRGLCPVNPARGIKRYRDRRFERFLTREEMARLAAALKRAEGRGENQYAIAAIRLLMLTGARKGEVLTLRWSWVDAERACLRLPDSKTGAKVIPLGEPAMQLLSALPRLEGSSHVFSGTRAGANFVGLQKVWERIRGDANLPDLRLHDLRHHFISTGASSGESLYVLGKLAGHKQPETTQRYAHLADDPVRRAADAIAKQISRAMRGAEPSEEPA